MENKVADMIIFLEWLDEHHVAKWVDDTTTHEDVAKQYLEERDG